MPTQPLTQLGDGQCPCTTPFQPPICPAPCTTPLLQVYAFGRVSCAVDNAQNAVLAQMGAAQGWNSVSLEQLLAEHERRVSAGGGAKH